MAGRLITVASYGNLMEAQIAKSALEAAGIRALIIGEHTAGNFQYHVKSIPLAVDEDDAEAAEQIVNAMMGIAHAERLTEEEPRHLCERCGSPDIERRKKMPAFGLFVALAFGIGAAIDNTVAAFYVVLAGIVFFLAAGAWRCRQCGNTWG
jgi:hypothetical protein